jgi:hypothetical protein
VTDKIEEAVNTINGKTISSTSAEVSLITVSRARRDIDLAVQDVRKRSPPSVLNCPPTSTSRLSKKSTPTLPSRVDGPFGPGSPSGPIHLCR